MQYNIINLYVVAGVIAIGDNNHYTSITEVTGSLLLWTLMSSDVL